MVSGPSPRWTKSASQTASHQFATQTTGHQSSPQSAAQVTVRSAPDQLLDCAGVDDGFENSKPSLVVLGFFIPFY